MEAVLAGESRALVMRGDPGVGKTALLDHLAGQASDAGCRVARSAGVQSEMELAFTGFAARRLAADPVGVVFTARDPGLELAGLPRLDLKGLPDDDARALLDTALAGPLDTRVRDLLIAETRGNPLALLELPRGLTPAELAGGFGLPGTPPLTGRIEDSFTRQLAALPDQTQRLVQLAAADPSGDRSLVRRAASRLSLPDDAGAPAAEAGLVSALACEVSARAGYRQTCSATRRKLPPMIPSMAGCG